MENNGIMIVRDPINLSEVHGLVGKWYDNFVKGVVDTQRRVIALGGQWHMDANNVLVSDGSKQENIWGFNVHPSETGEEVLEYISLINIRPAQGNRSMEIENEKLRVLMREIIGTLMPNLNI